MKTARAVLLVSFLAVFSSPAFSGPSINDMQSCQGLLDFIGTKLNTAPDLYPGADVDAVRLGLKQYNA